MIKEVSKGTREGTETVVSRLLGRATVTRQVNRNRATALLREQVDDRSPRVAGGAYSVHQQQRCPSRRITTNLIGDVALVQPDSEVAQG